MVVLNHVSPMIFWPMLDFCQPWLRQNCWANDHLSRPWIQPLVGDLRGPKIPIFFYGDLDEISRKSLKYPMFYDYNDERWMFPGWIKWWWRNKKKSISQSHIPSYPVIWSSNPSGAKPRRQRIEATLRDVEGGRFKQRWRIVLWLPKNSCWMACFM